MVAICWSRRSGLFEAHLKRLMGIVFGKKTAFEDFADLLTGIPRSRRYTLLHMCCLEVLGVDLESEVDLSKLQGVLQYYTLYALEAEHALVLFQRLRRARGDANLISVGPYNSVLSTRRSQVGFEGDPDINLLVLLNRTGRHEEAEIHAIKILEIRKQAAQTSTNRETRAEQVLSVWACANASGSIKLLREILQWAKGFIRDQLTASRLFSAYYDETYRLLSGFPVHGIWSLKSRDLRLRVEAANAFMMDMIEVAREGLREPKTVPLEKNVLTLPAPFPRGLPVQHLLALWSPNVLELDHVAPYVSSRVQETLFADPERALKPVPAPDPLMPAIGYFVDSYNYALTTYIPQDCDKKVKQARLLKAWNYAIGPLSLGRMEGPEAIRFWKPFVPSYLQSTLVDIQTSSRSVPWRPAIPTSDEPSQIQDWNPLEGRPLDAKIEARELTEPTYIDFCTSGQQTRHTKPDVGAFHDAPKPYIPAEYHPAPSLWSPSESFTLAALLVLDAKYGTTDRLLTEPFPSSSDVRFPCVFLDEEFLSSEEVKSSAAASYITNNLVSGYVDVPLPLVHKMTAGLVGKLDTQDSSQALEATALGLLKALADGDRPGLAFDLAIKVIMEQPDASSWHRILFNKGFLQRVPASDARAYIEKYADAIGERLDVLDSFKLSKTDGTGIDPSSSSCEDGTSQPDKPMIKVTTLKSLAQLLHGSKYIDEDVSLRILLNLCKKVKHIDVRVSILKTLLSKLKADRPELWDSVLSALGSFIPLVIRLDERQPGTQIDLSSEDDTSSMRETGQSNASSIDKPSIPVMRTTTNIMWQEGSPMLAAFLDHFEKLEGVQLWQAYMDRIMLPLMDGLIEQTANWTTLFLENFAPECVDVLKSDFPFVPKGSQILETVLSNLADDADEDGRSTIEHLVAHVNSLRTRAWEQNPDRTPAVLPDTFMWRLNLLTYPDHTRSDSDEAREKSSKDLAQQLTTLIDEISGSVYHAKLQQIKEHFKDEEGVVLTAIHLGNISKTRLSWLTMPELLKVDLAAEMLLRSKGRDIGPLGNRVRELLGTWTASENEDVRRTGYRLRGELFDADDSTLNDTVSDFGYDPSKNYHGQATIEVWTGGSSRQPVNAAKVVAGTLDRTCGSQWGKYCEDHGWKTFDTPYLKTPPAGIVQDATYFRIIAAEWANDNVRRMLINIVGSILYAYTMTPLQTNCYEVPGQGRFYNIPQLIRVHLPSSSPDAPGQENYWDVEFYGSPQQFSKHGNLKPCATRPYIDHLLDMYKEQAEQYFPDWQGKFSRDTRVIIDGWKICSSEP
ncbi:hypothetical protein N0V87_004148 [Didymella glomerata]|uniref:Uncharacterized protein n=1 Tax=Didymella glomerata TaxID=749621 RepID=A0A9W9C066_9PLEO|nr:hypothetical protein N0V87_004148 [Didymella glomerata]